MTNALINPVEIGERIRNLREKKHKSQSYYADLFYISPSYLALIESGKRVPNLEVFVQISLVCEVSLDYLIFGENPPKENVVKEFSKLSTKYSVKDMEQALRLSEYFLKLKNEKI